MRTPKEDNFLVVENSVLKLALNLIISPRICQLVNENHFCPRLVKLGETQGG